MRAPERGLTLLELLIALAILSILIVLALPAYTGYRLRATIAEGIGLALPLKYHAYENFQIDGVFPENNADIGLGDPSSYATDAVAGIGLSAGGVIRVEYSLPELGANRYLELAPCGSASGSVEWVCRGAQTSGVDPRYLPSSCRDLGASCVSNSGGSTVDVGPDSGSPPETTPRVGRDTRPPAPPGGGALNRPITPPGQDKDKNSDG
jgi:type IV pilus assembly protein PilA